MLELAPEQMQRLLAEYGPYRGATPRDWCRPGALLRGHGMAAEMSVPNAHRTAVEGLNVLGLWPGEDVSLDVEAIIVAAHYDGLGRLPDGTPVPGANDNASGVATMLRDRSLAARAGLSPQAQPDLCGLHRRRATSGA